VDAITTELVRADIAPSSMQVGQGAGYGPSVNVMLGSREDFDAAVSLFGIDAISDYEHDDNARVVGSGRFLGMFVTASAPAFPAVVADCDVASLS
jgi:hypothetical protein